MIGFSSMSQEKIDAFLEEVDHPEWVIETTKDHIIIQISEWDGEKQITVTPKDVAEYYATQANNMSSGCRTLAGHAGDWRPIDHLARFCLNYFKHIDIETMRKVSIERGLTPKF